jgi:hypothetical protein
MRVTVAVTRWRDQRVTVGVYPRSRGLKPNAKFLDSSYPPNSTPPIFKLIQLHQFNSKSSIKWLKRAKPNGEPAEHLIRQFQCPYRCRERPKLLLILRVRYAFFATQRLQLANCLAKSYLKLTMYPNQLAIISSSQKLRAAAIAFTIEAESQF